MTENYPPTWSPLKYPWQRAELLAVLAAAQNPSVYADATEMKFLVNFIFDDHDFSPAEQALGSILLDHDEVEAMNAFVAAFDAALGPRRKPLTAITAGEWSLVVAQAARAHERLLKQGKASFES